MSAAWRRLGAVAPEELVEPRLQLHFAAQVPAALGSSLLAPEPDFGHLAFAWDEEAGALTTGRTGEDAGLRAGLRVADGTWLLLADEEADALAAHGRTVGAGLDWLSDRVRERTGDARALAPPEHELPDHELGHDGTFALSARAPLRELAAWLANAFALLGRLRAEVPGAAPVRCWPHHFDVATLVSLDPERDPEEARSINLGLSPGDEFYAQPYWYVVPWPAPPAAELPPLELGRWRSQAWTGAVLRAEAALLGGPAEQGERAERFLREALAACRALL